MVANNHLLGGSRKKNGNIANKSETSLQGVELQLLAGTAKYIEIPSLLCDHSNMSAVFAEKATCSCSKNQKSFDTTEFLDFGPGCSSE